MTKLSFLFAMSVLASNAGNFHQSMIVILTVAVFGAICELSKLL